ncbi:hypothetical protein [Paenibacillus glacialis]|nr:hypothetical protein [Paenibacillus glacialis]
MIHKLMELLDVIPEESLDFTVENNMVNIRKQYRHIGNALATKLSR